MNLLNQSFDISSDFIDKDNVFFIADRIESFEPETGSGTLVFNRHVLETGLSFNQIADTFRRDEGKDFPSGEYMVDPSLPFSLSFVDPSTVRIRCSTGGRGFPDIPSLMLAGDGPSEGTAWEMSRTDSSVTYTGPSGSITIEYNPWHIEFRNAQGRLLTRTMHMGDAKALQNNEPMPFSFVRRSSDYGRRIAASFSIAEDERFYGCGESFTRLNKRGQKLVLFTKDAYGAQTHAMYKPIPFYLSSRGYGVFAHTSAPVTCDFGNTYDGAAVLYLGDSNLDLFFFFGEPKDVLEHYTDLTGRSPLPALWSFGLWMSRLSYFSEQEVRDVARKLRSNKIPCDVIHIDTGWFETDWRCDYAFSISRFKNPRKMIEDLREDGFRISLWQLPYFNPNNRLFRDIVDNGYAVRNGRGELPTEDAILDFSNPAAVKWYQGNIARLLNMGVGAIKVDFGEAAPVNGLYASGRTGFYEHNLYPLRYNKAVAEITRATTGESIIWARSAWAGSQRYPIHWGGDTENTDSAMAGTLRAGLSLGLCGFSFWSHDIGGFVDRSPEELYRRWLPFGMLTSHSRCHGAPPKEPWEYSDAFLEDFRRTAELKYRLMPYVYAQAADCSAHGFPMLRTLFFNYPADRTSWFIENEYLFGCDILVAPLMEAYTDKRSVYLPPGLWIDYQDGIVYEGGRWHDIAAGSIPAVILVRDGAVIPHIGLAQSTEDMVWSEIELVVFAVEKTEVEGLFSLPDDTAVYRLGLDYRDGVFRLSDDPLKGRVSWHVSMFPVQTR